MKHILAPCSGLNDGGLRVGISCENCEGFLGNDRAQNVRRFTSRPCTYRTVQGSNDGTGGHPRQMLCRPSLRRVRFANGHFLLVVRSQAFSHQCVANLCDQRAHARFCSCPRASTRPDCTSARKCGAIRQTSGAIRPVHNRSQTGTSAT